MLMTMIVWTVGCASLTDREEAIIHVQAARNPEKAARLTLLGVKAMQHADTDRATEKFLEAIAADESYGPAHNNLGLLHYEQGNLYQAVLALERAMELMPDDPSVLYNLALTLESAGKVHEALDLYWQTIEMDPVNPHFLGNLVRLRVRLGETGPDVVAQLQDLVLIETRPDWRGWADRLLALEFNDSLDRGPVTPDFNTRGGQQPTAGPAADRIIDLTPQPRSPSTTAATNEELPLGIAFPADR
jgi:tetratricopeptide (TPR) repeat protein